MIEAADIAAMQTPTLPDVLQYVPGLNPSKSGVRRANLHFMRGTNSNHVKAMVDGIDVSDPSNSNGAFDFGQFLTPDSQRVEVLRGPQSGLYGSDAIGGVINVITKSGSGPAQFAASIEGGSFDTFNQNASLSGSADRFHYSANFEHFHAGATPVTPLDALLPGEQRIDDYYDNLTGSTKLGYDHRRYPRCGACRALHRHARGPRETTKITSRIPFPTRCRARATTQCYTRLIAHNPCLRRRAGSHLRCRLRQHQVNPLEP